MDLGPKAEWGLYEIRALILGCYFVGCLMGIPVGIKVQAYFLQPPCVPSKNQLAISPGATGAPKITPKIAERPQ